MRFPELRLSLKISGNQVNWRWAASSSKRLEKELDGLEEMEKTLQAA
jgi:hypothetical protein